jgi:hypothetical protein
MDLGSFYGLKPSELNIDALEDTVVLQIASFLGISPEFLSRLRNKKSKKAEKK